MVGSKTKSSPIPHREGLRQHRRSRISAKKVIAFSINGVGDKLYYMGATIERTRKNFWRSIRKGVKAVFAGIFGVVKKVFGALSGALYGVWSDITMPFKKMRSSFKSLFVVIRSTKGRGFSYRMDRVRLFFKYGWMWNKHLIARLLNYLVPAVALALCVIVLATMVNLNYALKVSYNGQTVGYIESESVYDSARKIIQSRMIAGNDMDILKNDTVLSIAVVNSGDLASQDIMAESLLSVSGSEIADATGVFVGGVLYGATTAPAVVKEILDEIQAPFYAVAEQLGEDASVKFAREVTLEQGVYPASSVLPVEEILDTITSTTPGNIYYTARGGETLAEIALLNGISIGGLLELNPGLEITSVVENGTTLLVARDETLLRVKTVRNVVYTESVAFETRRIQDSSMTVQDYTIVQHGVAGERTIVKEMEYDATGNVVYENIISDVVTTPPIDQEIIVGTVSVSISSGGTLLAWPTGPGYFISRGFRAGGLSPHYGVDIAASPGTAIFAAESGTVITAMYTSVGYGNYIIVDHGNGMQTLYAHNSSLLVSEGDYVQRGHLIALMGSTGNSTGSHLHFEVRIQGTKVAPEEFIGLT